MATQGKIETNYVYGSSDKWYLRLNWNNPVQSISGNYTTFDWSVELVIVGSSSYVMGQDIYIYLGDTKYNVITSRQKIYAGTLGSGSHTVYHNASGKGSINAYLYGTIYYSSNNANASGTFYFNDIPRKAIASSVSNFTDNDNPTLYYNNPAGNAVSSLSACISFTGAKDDVPYRSISMTGSNYKFNLTETERETLRKGCVSSKSRVVYFYVRTILAGETYTSWIASTLTITEATPNVTFTAKDTNPTTTSLTGNNLSVIPGYSNLEMSLTTSVKKHASISRTSLFYNNEWVEGLPQSPVEATWNKANSINVQGWAKDSRGYEVYKESNLKLVPYFPPYCEVSAKVDSLSSTTATIGINISGKFFNRSFGTKSNSATVQYRYKQNNGSYGNWSSVSKSLSSDSFTARTTVNINYQNSITVQAKISDLLVTDIISNTVTIDPRPIFDWGKSDFNFNVPISINGTNIFKLIYPVGSIYTSVNNVNPSGIFGGTWEPFAQGRTLMGVDPKQNGFKLPEFKDGEKTHTLTQAEMPKHYHGVLNNDDNNRAALWPTKQSIWGSGTSAPNGAYGATGNGNNYLTTSYAGSGQAHNNLPPYITVYFWKRTA